MRRFLAFLLLAAVVGLGAGESARADFKIESFSNGQDTSNQNGGTNTGTFSFALNTTTQSNINGSQAQLLFVSYNINVSFFDPPPAFPEDLLGSIDNLDLNVIITDTTVGQEVGTINLTGDSLGNIPTAGISSGSIQTRFQGGGGDVTSNNLPGSSLIFDPINDAHVYTRMVGTMQYRITLLDNTDRSSVLDNGRSLRVEAYLRVDVTDIAAVPAPPALALLAAAAACGGAFRLLKRRRAMAA